MTQAVVRRLEERDLDAVGEVLFQAFAQGSLTRGFPPPWPSARDAERLAAEYARADPEGSLVAFDERIVGVGFVRRRGEIATIGPLAARPQRRGVGATLLDELISLAESWECRTIRLFQDAWNPDSFGLYAGRSFSVVDVVACVERPIGPAPRIDSSRGLEIGPAREGDFNEIGAMDLRFTGLDRRADLVQAVKWVARRRGAVVGFLGFQSGLLGPALAIDAADLGAMVARALTEVSGAASARLSTAAPTAVLAALALGFRVVSIGTVMSRGPSHPARPPQMYSMYPEVL